MTLGTRGRGREGPGESEAGSESALHGQRTADRQTDPTRPRAAPRTLRLPQRKEEDK